MIKNKATYIASFLLLLGAIGLYQIASKKGVFIALPIEGYSQGNIPYFKVKVKDQIIEAIIDLGYTGNLSIPQPFLSEIVKDQPATPHFRCGFHFQKLPTFRYQIDKISINNHDFFPSEIEAMNAELEKQKILVEGNPNKIENMGCIGWHLFRDYLLFMDFKNDQFILSDSLTTLKHRGYLTNKFTEIPFILQHGLIAFKAISDSGETQCILDTGCTWNMFNQYLKTPDQDKPLFTPKDTFDTALFQIGDKNFGPITFNRMYSRLNVEAFIGMEFLEDHSVIIDFKNQMLYFSPNDAS